MAWLDSTPEGYPVTRRQVNPGANMPEVHYGLHLINYLGDFKEVTYEEIDRWANSFNPKIELQRWEAVAMVKIKRAYDSMSIKARKKNCPAPYRTGKKISLKDARKIAKSMIPKGMMGKPISG